MEKFLLAALMMTAGLAAAENRVCDHNCLVGVLNNYESKVLAHQTDGIDFSVAARLTQNYRPIAPGEGYWQKLGRIYNQSQFADVTTGQTFAIGLANLAGQNAIFALRLKIGADHSISQSEMLLIKDGDATFLDTNPVHPISPVYEELVPEAQRSSRAAMLKLIEGFTDAWQYRNEDMTRFDPACTYYEDNVELTTPNGPAGDTCGGMLEYGGRNGVWGAGKAGQQQGGPPVKQSFRPADPSIGRPALFGTQMWMRDRRYPIIDVAHGVVVAYAIQGGQPARPGEKISYDAAAPFTAHSVDKSEATATSAPPPPLPSGKPSASPPKMPDVAAYMVGLYKIVAGRIVRVDHFEWVGGPNASGGFSDGPKS